MWFVVAVAVFCALYNNVFNLFRPETSYVPVNLAVAATLVLAARARGFGWDDLGFGGLGAGLRWGGAIALLIAAGLAVATISDVRALGDARVAGVAGSVVAYRALVRIPLGTVVLEEVAFRGVLFGAWSRHASVLAAVVGSSAIFGLWHIVPSLELWRVNDLTGGPVLRTLFVFGAVVATGAGGAFLVWLRIRTGGIWAPMIVHASANSLATLASFAAQRA